MLKNIKSLYLIKNIFSHISKETKLKLVKYNNNLQKKLNINLINYKILSGRYNIFEAKRKGKEYDYFGNLIYEGEYLKGKRNGKGKEYNRYKKVIFEGEYLNGKRWNGKIYYEHDDENFENKKYL